MHFFWFCAGANTRVLRECPASEHNKMAGIGAAVLFTGILAGISGGYALYVAWDSMVLSILFGIFWGMIIFNLDRFMVATIKKGGPNKQYFWPAIPRILLAMVLALVISKPLELRIFDSEIEEVLADQKLVKLTQIEEQFQAKVLLKEQAIDNLLAATEAKLQIRETAYQEYRCECDGTCGTGKVGRGSECERKERRYLQADREFQEAKSDNDQQIAAVRNEIDQIKQDAQTTLAETEQTYSSGLVARLKASGQLPLAPRLFIPLLIFIIELSPILAKLLAPAGPYEKGLYRVEESYNIVQEKMLEQQRQELEKESKLLQHIHRVEIEETIEQKRRAIKDLSNAQLQILKQQIDQWLTSEKKRMNDDR